MSRVGTTPAFCQAAPVDTFRSRVQHRLDVIGISQSELERRTGLSKGYASRLLSGDRGTRMDLDLIARLADTLGCSYEWLAVGRGPETPTSGVVPPPPGIPFPHLDLVIQDGKWDPRTVAHARQVASLLWKDPGEGIWWPIMHAYEKAHEEEWAAEDFARREVEADAEERRAVAATSSKVVEKGRRRKKA